MEGAMSSELGWICTDPECLWGSLTEAEKDRHEEKTGHEVREVDA